MRHVNHIEDGVGIVILSQRQIVVESATANNDVALKIIKKDPLPKNEWRLGNNTDASAKRSDRVGVDVAAIDQNRASLDWNHSKKGL